MLVQFILPASYLHSIENSVGKLYERVDGTPISEKQYASLIEEYGAPVDYAEDYNVFDKSNGEHIIVISKWI